MECLRGCFRSGHDFLRRISSPWFVSDTAQRKTNVLDRAALGFKRRCHAHQSKRVARAVADLPVAGVPCERQWREVDRGDQFTRLQAGLDLRRVTGKTMKIVHSNAARAAVTLNLYRGIERRERDAHIRWMGGNAAFGRPQNGMDSIKAADCIANRRRASVYCNGKLRRKSNSTGCVASGAPGGRHISNLSGCAKQN